MEFKVGKTYKMMATDHPELNRGDVFTVSLLNEGNAVYDTNSLFLVRKQRLDNGEVEPVNNELEDIKEELNRLQKKVEEMESPKFKRGDYVKRNNVPYVLSKTTNGELQPVSFIDGEKCRALKMPEDSVLYEKITIDEVWSLITGEE